MKDSRQLDGGTAKKFRPRVPQWREKLGVIVCLLLLPLFAGAQSKTVTLQVKDKSVEEIILELRETSGYRFLFNHEEVKDLGTKTIDLQNAPIAEVMAAVLEGTGMTFRIENDVIVIQPKQPTGTVKEVRVQGQVRDEQGQPLPGVTVLLKGTTVGTATDVNGRFSLSVPKVEDITFIFSFVGLDTKEVKLGKQTELNIVLKPSHKSLDEVVITGYQSMQVRSMAGSASVIDAEDLVLNGTQTLEQALQGQIPGMTVINKSGLTGTRQRIRVRGTSTLLGNAEPVWVVDGIIQEDPLPFETNDFNALDQSNMDMIRDFVGGAISWLNPNDIDKITVLKDASATAIYGTRAANGVIVITTKKGQVGRMTVSYSGNVSFSPKLNYNRMELMNSQQRVEVSREAFEKRYIVQSQDLGYTADAWAFKRGEISLEEFTKRAKEYETNNTDWFDIFFRNAFSHNHSFSLSGGKDKTTYRASIGYNITNNTAKGNDLTSYTANLNLSTILWDRLTFNGSLSGSLSKTNAFTGSDPYSYATQTARTIKAYDENGDLQYYRHSNNNYLFNMINELEQSGNTNKQSSLNTNFSLKLDLWQGVDFTMTFGYNANITDGESWYTEQSNYIANLRGYNFEEYAKDTEQYLQSELPHGGELNKSYNSSTSLTWRNQLNFYKLFKEKHLVTATLGYEMRSSKSYGYRSTTYGYMPDKGKLFVDLPKTVQNKANKNDELPNSLLGKKPSITDTQNNNLSYYLTAAYTYDDRYVINANIRTDASNRFGQNKKSRFLPVWALGLRWNIGRESWFANQTIVSDASLRLSYGWQGNVATNVSPDLIANITTADGDYALSIDKLPAPDLRWEKVHNFNVGIDFSFLDNRISGGFEWYTKKTLDMVIDQQVPYENGISTRPINGGEMSNSGWDAHFTFVPVRTPDWNVSFSFNLSKTNNSVKSTLEPTGTWKEATGGNLNKKGYPVSSFWAFRFKGLNSEHGGPEFDLTGIETPEARRDATLYLDYAGKLDPDFTTNLNFNIRYKKWTLSSGLYFSLGNQQFMAPMSTNYKYIPNEYENMSTEWLDRWRQPGDEMRTNTPSLPDLRTSAKTLRIEVADGDGRTKWETLSPYEMYANSTIRVVDAWYIRCNNISLSYNVPTEKLPKFISNISMNASVSNPFQIRSKEFLGRDPEVLLGEQPRTQNYTLGINISF